MLSMDRGFLQDERGVTVIFGTLMLILIIIAGVSGLALIISESQKNMMERQERIEAVENENLKIVSIDPSVRSGGATSWDAMNITVLNVDILDSKISAVSLNDKFSINYVLLDGRGNFITHRGTDYPIIYNYRTRAEIPAGKSSQIHVGIPDLEIYTEEDIDLSDWRDDNKLDEDWNVSLENSPWKAYSDPEYWVNISDSYGNSFSEDDGDFDLDENNSVITINHLGDMNLNVTDEIDTHGWNDPVLEPYVIYPLNYGPISLAPYFINVSYAGNGTEIMQSLSNWTVESDLEHLKFYSTGMSNDTIYNVNYTRADANFTVHYTTVFEGFPESMEVGKSEPITVEIISSLVNIFKQMFMPPEPLAEVQVKTERRLVNGSETWEDFLLLDASNSYDPDGFITSYRWEVTCNGTEELYGFEDGDAELRGTKARPKGLDLVSAYNITIDLEVKDDTGMVSRLSDTSGKIVIYEK